MNSRSWNTITLATIFTVAVANCALAYMLDPYGLWRDPVGRKLSVAVITNGRKAKFLMSKRYIPANFGGLIIGPSSIANWDVSNLGGAQIYNLAIDGADSAEERLVLDQALLRGRYKIAVFALVPIITANHEVKGGLDSTTTAESVASFHLYIQEVAYALRAAHRETDYVDIAPNGHYNYHKKKNLEHWDLDPDLFTIDPVALKHYREMILKLQSQGATIFYVVPPIYEEFYQLHRADYETYSAAVRALLPNAPVIDFTSSEYVSLRNDPSNFVDIMHLEPQGAQTFSALLSTFVSQTLERGQ
jgi:hypothetical protein